MNEIDTIQRPANKQEPFRMEFMPGCHIREAIRQAIAFATEKDWPVAFKFNDVELQVTKDSDVDMVATQFSDACNARSKAYRESPAGIASAERMRVATEKASEGVEEFAHKILALEAKEENKYLLAELISMYAPHADFFGTQSPQYKDGIIAKINEFGYVEGDCIGDVGTPEKLQRWAMGQIISTMNMMDSGVPHPALITHLDKAFARAKLEN